MKNNNKKKNIIIKIIGGSSILTIGVFMAILICVLMIFDFFGEKLTKDKVENNAEYADAYIEVINKNIRNGYVPLQRLLYFSLEDSSLNFDTLYSLNQNIESKTAKEITSVCEDERLSSLIACSEEKIQENNDYLIVSSGHFNFPLDTNSFTVTSFFNHERIIYGNADVHHGWDLAVPAQTPVYSVCGGTVTKVHYTQNTNVPFDQSGNSVGNVITIRCDEDYNDVFYVIYAHLFPNSAKVKVGDKVGHWTEVASVGTTGNSTGNHLHYQVEDANGTMLDGMQFIDFKLKRNGN